MYEISTSNKNCDNLNIFIYIYIEVQYFTRNTSKFMYSTNNEKNLI